MLGKDNKCKNNLFVFGLPSSRVVEHFVGIVDWLLDLVIYPNEHEADCFRCGNKVQEEFSDFRVGVKAARQGTSLIPQRPVSIPPFT